MIPVPAANVFCPTGEGGGVDPSCSPGVPGIPKFISSNKANVEANVKASEEMLQLALKGDAVGLKAHPGTPSPKVQEYRDKLLKYLAKKDHKQGIPKTKPPKNLPDIPVFKSSNKANVMKNIEVAKAMKALATKGDLKGLQGHPGTPSPKLEQYRQALLAALSGAKIDQLPAPKVMPLKDAAILPPTKLPEKEDAPNQATIKDLPEIHQQVAKYVGIEAAEIAKAVTSPAHPHTQASEVRAKVVSTVLTNGLAVKDAVLHLNHKVADAKERVKAIGHGDAVDRAIKEYAHTPIYDLNILSKIVVISGQVPGQALCNLASRSVSMGSTSVTGDFRHELGHAVRAAMGGEYHKENSLTKAVAEEFSKLMARLKADPPPPGAKLDHETWETKYGAVGRRCIDNWEENCAEHYRLYHRELYRDREEGGNGKWLKQYRDRHPGWARIWDAWYTGALLGG
jgi:hypothetical protein